MQASPVPRSPCAALAALGVATLVLTSDVTAMATALPTIETSLGTDLTSAQWVMNAYLIAFGMTIVTGGRLADQLGRRNSSSRRSLRCAASRPPAWASRRRMRRGERSWRRARCCSPASLHSGLRGAFVGVAALAGAGAVLALARTPGRPRGTDPP